MTVFKGYMKVIRQSRWLILMYVAIFFCLHASDAVSGRKRTEKSFSGRVLENRNCV